jgi:hypothetical protein
VVVVPGEVEGDLLLAGDHRTALVLLELANSVCGYTSFKVDYPSAHSSGWMPLLDIQIRVNSDNSVDWTFYRKEVSSPYTILNTSALPGRVKRVSLVQEGLRRLRNTRPSLVAGQQKQLMEDLADMMMISGYPEKFRAGVIRSAVVGYERLAAKQLKRAAWHRPADAVLFVPATPDSQLAELARKVLEEEAGRLAVSVRVVETGGVSMKRQLVRTDLAAGEPCWQGDCPACLSNPGQGGGLRHQRSGALYTGTCRLCPQQGRGTAVYTGESGFNAYTRLCTHRDDIRRQDQKNAFSKHLREEHPEMEGEEAAFCFDVVRTFTKPMERQVAEAVAIHSCPADTILNSKSEWEQPATERLVVTRDLPDRDAGGAAARRGRGRGRRGGV